ncbi:immunoglobulin superfamily member 5 [Gouania willdenowi]|uniref:Ig-like domain-containing protein n=1 Tax=Gouania willdenowi TaxID=441366 RepID=A0A8C5EUX7_GOUWI|nr:immunoglobulin superfamily member 5 [Gouania willdenowi]
MTVAGKSWLSLLVILPLLSTEVMSNAFQLEPLNPTVLQGSDAHFNATVFGDWKVMTWTVQDLLVLTAQAPDTIISASDEFSARFCADIRCVEFTIKNVTRAQAGPVMCTIQGDFGQKTAHLEVQESGTVSITGGNVTVVQDQLVDLQCITTDWFPPPNVTWTQNSQPVNPSQYSTTSTPSGDSFTSTSNLTLQAVRNTTVQCLATVPTLPVPLSSSVILVVVPKPSDWTVLIAVVASFGGLALLVLLIIGIIFCCKRRKETKPNYQDEMMRTRTQSQLSGVHRPEVRKGQVNSVYEPENRTSAAPSEVTDSGFFQANTSNISEMPDVVNSNQVWNSYNNSYENVEDSGFKKHRHVTIV